MLMITGAGRRHIRDDGLCQRERYLGDASWLARDLDWRGPVCAEIDAGISLGVIVGRRRPAGDQRRRCSLGNRVSFFVRV